jgi:hypothetical protein
VKGVVRLFLRLRLSLHIEAVRAFVRLNVLETAMHVSNGVQLPPRLTAMGSAAHVCHNDLLERRASARRVLASDH